MSKNILIGGEAGQGLKTISSILGKTLFRMDYHVFSSKNYMSRIRGGHNFIKIRFDDKKVNSPADELDMIVALNEETIDLHKDELKENGLILFDEEREIEGIGKKIPARDIASEINIKGLNTVYVGAVLKLLGLKLDSCKKVIREFFEDDQLIDDNLKLLNKGYQEMEEKFDILPAEQEKDQLFINGNEAIGLGAVMAGVKYYTAYPMSPSTGILNYIAGKQDELGIAVEQAEDEIGAINMALGASYGGIRSMTGTSGGGLALMAEAVGLAGITETPLVIAEVQRPGPATGLPTRTEQGDLQFAVNISQGEFPLMVISPRDQEDAFYQTFRAHNLAEKYQLPVIILSDQFLADSAKNVDEFDIDDLEINRHMITDEEAKEIDNYNRYEFTGDGISPRAYPGQIPGGVVLADSDEHNQHGNIIEDAETRVKMVDKRRKKLDKLINEDLKEPEFIGAENINYLLVGWGSTYGPLTEARELLLEDGYQTGCLSFSDLYPLPEEKITEWSEKDVEIIVVENNATGQFARLITGETGIEIDENILKYDGRPFTGEEIYQRCKKEVIK